MTQTKRTNGAIFKILLVALIPIAAIFLVSRFGRNQANQNLSELIEASERDLHIKDRFTMEGYVGKNQHRVYLYVVPYSSITFTDPTDAAFHCPDIDSAQVWLLYPKNTKDVQKTLDGANYKIEVEDHNFNQTFEIYCSSIEYAEQVFTPEIRQKILENKAFISGSWGLVNSSITYIKQEVFKTAEEMDKITDVGEVLIERMHDIAN